MHTYTYYVAVESILGTSIAYLADSDTTKNGGSYIHPVLIDTRIGAAVVNLLSAINLYSYAYLHVFK